MAKAGRKPEGKVVADLDATLRRDIDLAVDSDANESARSIYGRFGLSQREINLRTFRKYVSDRRRERRTQTVAKTLDLGNVPTLEELRMRCHIGILECLQAGEAKPYELASILARIQDADRIEIQREAEDRARELHDFKVKQLTDDLRKDVDEKTANGTKTITRDDVFDMIDAIMRNQG